MIVCHQYEYIFLKTNKTAGTSVEIALSKFCGQDDVITPISPADEEARTALGYRGAQNLVIPLKSYGAREAVRLLRDRDRPGFYNHMPAREVRPLVGEDVWNGYYKFYLERNPWDRVISFYYWKCQDEPRPRIAEFLELPIMQTLKRRGYEVYTIDGELVVDRILRFEDLDGGLEEVRKHVGIPDPLTLPRAKSSSRKDRRSYREILTEEERDRIAEMFADEIRLFGYEF